MSWNVSAYLDACIRSIHKHAGSVSYEIIVTDNDSADDTLKMLEQHPDVKVIANKHNAGFSAANNQGFRIAKGEYIFILNPDTELLEGALQKLVKVLDEDTETDMVGPKLVYNTEHHIQQTCARKLPNAFTIMFDLVNVPLAGRKIRTMLNFPYNYETDQPVEGLSGAAMLIRADALMPKGLDETYTFCGEDLELCYRVLQTNKKIMYVHDAVILHWGGKSSSKDPLNTTMRSLRGNYHFQRQCMGWLNGFVYRAFCQYFFPVYLLSTGVILYAAGKESKQEFSYRRTFAKRLFSWK